MCLVLNESQKKVLIAPYNIICFKHLDNNNISEYNSFQYIYGKINSFVNLKISNDTFYMDHDSYVINEGYHSRNKRSKYIKFTNRIFMIPKDTKFYLGSENNINTNDNYVSETIIMLGNNNIFTRWYYTWKYNLKSYV